ncbi:D-alanyl-D-alanine carboxypeptidase family protein [Cytobacillus sp. FJAT-54145]|uniref:serine-type D-Ala-D-Ala carboxypeptidase n=1 Tax=Cytobacillus spartinae TaxID=3299023 RepID=A0ABW6KFF7_9BACI
MKKFKIISTLIMVFTIASSQTNVGHAISAKGAILMEQESGRVLYERNAHTQMRIASITKIMTAILAIESGKLEEEVEISERAARTEGSSLYIKPGDKVKLIELTYGLMLRSGNDSAVAIAEHVSGSVEDFVKIMNKKAKEIGMKNTIFANPHGLDDHENHYSTAYDMALLTQYAMKNETFAKVTGTKQYKCESLNSTWNNKHRLVTGLYKYTTGGKTGYTRRAKRTLVSTAEKDGLKLIVVTINDRNDWKDHMSLFNQGFSTYESVKIIDHNDEINVDSSLVGNVYTKEDFIFPLKGEEREGISLKVVPKKGKDTNKPVGKVEVYLKDELIGELDFYVKQPFKEEPEEKGLWDKIKSIF